MPQQMDVFPSSSTIDNDSQMRVELGWGYQVEKWLYGIAVLIGIGACIYTITRFIKCWKTNFEIAARLLSYKISLSVADTLILFVYAPTQFVWISSYWWYGGDTLCRLFKFLSTFAFHLTGNMQAIIAIDRVYIMTRINRVNGKKAEYKTNMVLGGAWSLALLCSVPQLFVFHEASSATGEPQCVAAWVVSRYEHQEHIDYFHYYNHLMELIEEKDEAVVFPNGTLRVKPPEKPALTMDEIDNIHIRMQKLEQIYNAIHLVMMCFAPYLVELISYAMIISLLNDAKRGQFLGLKGWMKSRIVKVPCVKVLVRLYTGFNRQRELFKERALTSVMRQERMKDCDMKIVDRMENGKEEYTLLDVEDIVRSPQSKKMATFGLRESNPNMVERITIESPPIQRPSSYIHLMEREDDESEGKSLIHTKRMSDSVMHLPVWRSKDDRFAVVRSLSWTVKNPLVDAPLSTAALEILNSSKINGHCTVERKDTMHEDKRRNSAPCAGADPTKFDLGKPWFQTVCKAKRKTKKKALYMLTLNLLFWLPYCFHAIISALIIFEDFEAFQFVSALVCFNAICNIIL